jgi:hypothetical protein
MHRSRSSGGGGGGGIERVECHSDTASSSLAVSLAGNPQQLSARTARSTELAVIGERGGGLLVCKHLPPKWVACHTQPRYGVLLLLLLLRLYARTADLRQIPAAGPRQVRAVALRAKDLVLAAAAVIISDQAKRKASA